MFPFIKIFMEIKKSAYAKYMGDAIFKVPTPVMLDKIVTAMDEIYEKMEQLRSEDVRGDIYEYLLSKLATAGVKRTVPYTASYHKNDGRNDGSKSR